MDVAGCIAAISDETQREIIKYELLLETDVTNIHKRLVKALSKRAYARCTVAYWAHRFRNGEINVQGARGGAHNIHPECEDPVNLVKNQLCERRDWTVVELAHPTGIPASSVRRILKDELKMKKKLCQWVPHVLTEENVLARIEVCTNNLLRLHRRPTLLNRTLAVDETWVSLYTEPKSNKRRLWMNADEEPPRVAH